MSYDNETFWDVDNCRTIDVDEMKERVDDAMKEDFDEYEWISDHYSASDLWTFMSDGRSVDEITDRMSDEIWEEACYAVRSAIEEGDSPVFEVRGDEYMRMKCCTVIF